MSRRASKWLVEYQYERSERWALDVECWTKREAEEYVGRYTWTLPVRVRPVYAKARARRQVGRKS